MIVKEYCHIVAPFPPTSRTPTPSNATGAGGGERTAATAASKGDFFPQELKLSTSCLVILSLKAKEEA